MYDTVTYADAHRLQLGRLLQLHVREGSDGSLALHLARCSPNANPADPDAYCLTRAGFILRPDVVPHLRAILAEVAP